MTTCEWLLSETEANVVELPLQFNGFCGYTFVCRDGLLLPGSFHSLSLHKYSSLFFVSRLPVPHWAANCGSHQSSYDLTQLDDGAQESAELELETVAESDSNLFHHQHIFVPRKNI